MNMIRNQAVVIPAHENEITHTVCHRESYCELYTEPSRFGDRTYPWPRIRPIHWGESLTVTPSRAVVPVFSRMD